MPPPKFNIWGFNLNSLIWSHPIEFFKVLMASSFDHQTIVINIIICPLLTLTFATRSAVMSPMDIVMDNGSNEGEYSSKSNIRLFKLKPQILNFGGRKNQNWTDHHFFGSHFAQIKKEIFY